ncbi:hypothetical protein BEWA_032840 [Theileria equi strain WA]|uniref:Protein BCCIP homolog n=1 Tax=Theileria equi strain WA TaxID=1537102 RepID=L0AZL5_THEEQ|nr:hypothetical protein BEWA_032840 [Theileria equi strain WA]AFZ80431.1 hypothetical protein BEWA_032840 [Theileria equi strain WA]|eukprot:XP_004830097.1 hypothetical protein BEWA_032840 [Theileria equi strain WA]
MSSDLEDNPKRHKPNPEDDQEGSEDEQQVEADFLFNDPSEEDKDGILTLIQGSMKKFSWEVPQKYGSSYSYLAELISNQGNIGTLIKVEDEESSYVMAVLTLLNINQYDGLDGIGKSLIAAAKVHGAKDDSKKLQDILSDKKNQIALVINERMHNVPAQLIGQFQECLQDDIKWSLSSVDEEEEREFYKFTHLIGITRVYMESGKGKEGEYVYLKPEEQFYVEEATVKFMWATGESNKIYTDANETGKKFKILPEHALFFCVPFSRYASIVKKIAKTFK